MTLHLTFLPIDDSLYQWACRDSGETIYRRGCYELGWEPWSCLPDGTETFSVYFRVGEFCSKSIEAITVSEFYRLPDIVVPEPIIEDPMEIDCEHRCCQKDYRGFGLPYIADDR
jgi:hypothetical protein